MNPDEIPEVEMTQEELETAVKATQDDKAQQIQQAQLLVAQEKQRRAQACGVAIERVLRQYRCVLNAIPAIEDGRIIARVMIAPQD